MSESSLKKILVFSTSDIKKQGTYSVCPQINPADFASAFSEPNVIKSISLKLDFAYAVENIALRGQICAELVFECDRCGAPIVRKYNDNFDDCFANSVEYIDLSETVREVIALLKPMKVLCSEKCKGRCPQCGADLNKEKCSCKAEKVSPFAALKDFRVKK